MGTRRIKPSNDFLDHIGRNMSSTRSRFDKNGENPSVGTTEEDIWVPGGRMTWLTAESTLDVVSSSANDALGGTGAQIVLIYGVDENYAVVSELVNMNGTTPVTTTANFFRVNSAQFVFAGSTGYNEGNITITATTGGSTQAYIEAEVGVHHSMNFSVPAGYNLILYDIVTSNAANQEIFLRTYVRAAGAGLPFWSAYTTQAVPAATVSSRKRSIPSIIPEQTDVNIRVRKVSGTSGYFHMSYSGYLIKDDNSVNTGRTFSIGL